MVSSDDAVYDMRVEKHAADFEYYLNRKPSADDLLQLGDWLSNHPDGDIASYVDAMKEIDAL